MLRVMRGVLLVLRMCKTKATKAAKNHTTSQKAKHASPEKTQTNKEKHKPTLNQ